MSYVLAFLKQNFVAVISYMDNFNLFGNFSVLDFNVTLLIFGAILPIVIVTVSNWSNGSINRVEIERRNKKGK